VGGFPSNKTPFIHGFADIPVCAGAASKDLILAVQWYQYTSHCSRGLALRPHWAQVRTRWPCGAVRAPRMAGPPAAVPMPRHVATPVGSFLDARSPPRVCGTAPISTTEFYVCWPRFLAKLDASMNEAVSDYSEKSSEVSAPLEPPSVMIDWMRRAGSTREGRRRGDNSSIFVGRKGRRGRISITASSGDFGFHSL